MGEEIKIEYESCFVAYIDILGFKKKVHDTEKNSELLGNLIKSMRVNEYFTRSSEKDITTKGKRKIEIRSYFFSDSFVFIMRENKADLPHLFLIIRYLQDRFWENNLFFRGAITKGKMYWPNDRKENIILGPAMIKAYELESQIAIFPRIVISRELSEYIDKQGIEAFPISINKNKLKEFIKEDEDRVLFFDILNPNITRKNGEGIKQKGGSFSINWDNSAEDNYEDILEQVEKTISEGNKNRDEE